MPRSQLMSSTGSQAGLSETCPRLRWNCGSHGAAASAVISRTSALSSSLRLGAISSALSTATFVPALLWMHPRPPPAHLSGSLEPESVVAPGCLSPLGQVSQATNLGVTWDASTALDPRATRTYASLRLRKQGGVPRLRRPSNGPWSLPNLSASPQGWVLDGQSVRSRTLHVTKRRTTRSTGKVTILEMCVARGAWCPARPPRLARATKHMRFPAGAS